MFQASGKYMEKLRQQSYNQNFFSSKTPGTKWLKANNTSN